MFEQARLTAELFFFDKGLPTRQIEGTDLARPSGNKDEKRWRSILMTHGLDCRKSTLT